MNRRVLLTGVAPLLAAAAGRAARVVALADRPVVPGFVGERSRADVVFQVVPLTELAGEVR